MITDLHSIRSRQDMIRLFDGHLFVKTEDVDRRRDKRPVVKSHLLEVLGGCSSPIKKEDVLRVFSNGQFSLHQIDDDLLSVCRQQEVFAFLEILSPRIVAMYSILESQEIEKHIRTMVSSSPELDYVWLSGITFSILWKTILRLCDHNRFVQIAFTHDSIFDVDTSSYISDDEEEQGDDDNLEQEEIENTRYHPVVERRAARFRLTDRIRVVEQKLNKLQDAYAPLHAISQIRFPSSTGKGGHDFYDNGKVTNRTDSFLDHRSHLLYVTKIYDNMLRKTESQTCYGPVAGMGTRDIRIEGAPLIVQFDQPLSREVFDQWIRSTFGRQNNRFRLWGHPIRLGPTKIHVYGLDRHLWQPLFLEITESGCVAIIPKGTCGNTVHRLITNIQRYLDPNAKAFLGDQRYESMVEAATQEVQYDKGE